MLVFSIPCHSLSIYDTTAQCATGRLWQTYNLSEGYQSTCTLIWTSLLEMVSKPRWECLDQFIQYTHLTCAPTPPSDRQILQLHRP